MIKRLLVGQDPEIVNIENDLAVEIEGAQGLEIGKGLDQETVREVDLEIVKKVAVSGSHDLVAGRKIKKKIND